MNKKQDNNKILSLLPQFSQMDAAARRLLDEHGRIIQVAKGSVIFRPGSVCETYLIVIEGSVRTSMVSDSGREIVLYRVESGQSCVLTTSCLLGGLEYNAEGVAETDIVALGLPRSVFLQLLEVSESFRQLAFGAFSERLRDLMVLINEVAFGQIDRRLAAYLMKKAKAGEVRATHQEIAVELGTAREVVSRVLKDFEGRGIVGLERGRIRIVSPQQLSM